MKIVILDGYTINPGDLSWDDIKALGDCDIYDRTPPPLVIERARGARIALANKITMDGPTLDALPDLRLIAVSATGYNSVDTEAARKRGVLVCNVPEYGTPNVAQATFALLLELTNRTGHHDRTVHEGRWSAAPDWCYWDYPLIELDGLTLGIVGYGRIGRAVAKIAQAFGMRILACRRNPGRESPDPGVELTDLDTLFRRSDVVSLHCPLTPETRNMVNTARLAQMKPTAYLINTSRGGLVSDTDLSAALNAGRIAGAGLDVLPVEPPPSDSPLISAKNCIITPHIAWASRPARKRLLGETVENVRSFLAGNPRNIVNP
jgi:glycerate dehydrogenase